MIINSKIKKRVAIFQNTLTGGGRIRVIRNIIIILNELNIIPDIFTFKVNPSFTNHGDLFFRIKKIPQFIRGFYELKMPLLNLIMRFYEKKYDLMINSNNSLLFVPPKINTIAYIHFLRENRIISKYASIAFPDGQLVSEKNIGFRLYRKLINYLYSFRVLPYNNNIIITNSEYTKHMFKEAYRESTKREIKVIYPPVSLNDWKSNCNTRNNAVVTLGRFGKDKRQLEQLKISECLPEIHFHIIGFVGDKNSKRYYTECCRYIREHKIKNVTLHQNLSHEKIKKILQKSKYFMHNLRNEPFGISTVEAIASGCIPIVHDSGGQKEIVPFEELRFDDLVGAVEKINKLNNQDLKSISRHLENHINQFDFSIFKKRVISLLLEVLSNRFNNYSS